MKLSFWNRFGLAVFTGILLSLAWTNFGLGPILLISFFPLLLVEDFFYNNKDKFRSIRFFNISYIAFFTWNLASTWWIYYASAFGALGAIICNSFIMAFVFWLFHITKRKLGSKIGYFGLLFFWLAFEWVHFNWDLDYPWLTIGNGFSRNITIIQWYEYTGVLGGSLWVVLSNILFFNLYLKYKNGFFKSWKKPQFISFGIFILLLIIPVAISLIQYYTYEEKGKDYDIVVVQPNIDPYNEKFDNVSPKDQLIRILKLASEKADSTVDFFVGPETALVNYIWENKIQQDPAIKLIASFLSYYPSSEFIIGASTLRLLAEGEPKTVAARKLFDSAAYYESYNTALLIDSARKTELYHKSKLVIGVEKIPYPVLFSYFERFALDLGGTIGTLGTQKERTPLTSHIKPAIIAPVICYESAFGEYVSEFIRNGANLIFVITNDGWWEDTPGYKQHLSYSCLRAIENRRSIARSANTGISCFINQRGEIIQATNWWETDCIRNKIKANDEITFYTASGDYIGRIAGFLSLLLLIYLPVKKIIAKKH